MVAAGGSLVLVSGRSGRRREGVRHEWNNKAAGFVGYEATEGVRAVEQLRLIAAEVQLADVRNQVGLSYYHDFESFSTFTPLPLRTDRLTGLPDQVVAWSTALRPLRDDAA
jgi:NAD(P)H-dependent FMN reductase